MTSEARVKCVPNTMIMGVGCGNSYSISNPTRSFIRKTFPWPRSQHGYEAVDHKPSIALFDRDRHLDLQKRHVDEKTIANCRDCAHGALMSKRAVVSAHMRRHTIRARPEIAH